ncbi:hypothetical protein FH972_026998 [Carpinus fangiana]|uniref:Uncharacterized protein n=1 Tax=Carpinus fangiana TaxID=176857 RepID=A0A5N6L5N7_9ROSI|nr:hypothetical protein FH972_026998 [Carpinus fangiana]
MIAPPTLPPGIDGPSKTGKDPKRESPRPGLPSPEACRKGNLSIYKIAYESGPTNPAEHRSTLRIASNNRIAAQPDPFKTGTISTNFGGLPSGRVRLACGKRANCDIRFFAPYGRSVSGVPILLSA